MRNGLTTYDVGNKIAQSGADNLRDELSTLETVVDTSLGTGEVSDPTTRVIRTATYRYYYR